MYRPAGIAVNFVHALTLPLAVLACGGSDLILPSPGSTPAVIQIVKGNEQSGAPGTMLPDSIVVRVTDSAGSPLPGHQVEFLPDPPGAAVTPQTATTNSAGIAGARWVLDATPGPQEVIARVIAESEAVELQVRFTAIADISGSIPALVLLTQPSSSVRAGEVLSRQPVVQIRDAAGEEIKTPGVQVTAAIVSGGGSLGGTSTRLTDENGRAEFTDLRIDGASGPHVLIFAAAGYTSVISEPVEVSPVEPDNQPPVVADDEYQTIEGLQYTLRIAASDGVLQNDQDPEGDLLVASNASDPPNGRVSLDRDGSFSYTPDPDFFGDDYFTYRASDPSRGVSIGRVTIHVLPVNDSPRFQIAVDPVVVSAGSASRRITNFVTGIRPGPPNESDQILTFEVVGNSNPGLFASGPAVVRDGPDRDTGTLSFTPAAGRTGSATITLVLRDNGGTAYSGADSSSETFTIRVE